jgi:hypothetical protein
VSTLGRDGFGPAVLIPELSSPSGDARPAIRRESVAAKWSCPVNVGFTVNSASNDLQAALSYDAQVLLFSSNRPGGFGSDDIWMSKREKRPQD